MKEENLPEGTGKKRSDDLGGAFFLKKEPFHRSHARPRKPRRKQAPRTMAPLLACREKLRRESGSRAVRGPPGTQTVCGFALSGPQKLL